MEYAAFKRMKERSDQVHRDNVRFYSKLSKIQENPSGISSLSNAQLLSKKMEKLAVQERKNMATPEFLAIMLNKRLLKHNSNSFRKHHYSIDHSNNPLPNLHEVERIASINDDMQQRADTL